MLDNWKILTGYVGSFGFASISLSSIMDCSLTIFSVLGALFGCIGALLTMLLQYKRFRQELKKHFDQKG